MLAAPEMEVASVAISEVESLATAAAQAHCSSLAVAAAAVVPAPSSVALGLNSFAVILKKML